MRRYLLISLLLIMLVFPLNIAKAADLPAGKAGLVLSGDLVEQSNFYDNQVILFRGEVIGDVMFRGDHAWINVNDDSYGRNPGKLAGYNSGQSIWCKADDAKTIKVAGDYFHIGDYVEIEGVFHRACHEHGGDMDIHAAKIRLIDPGKNVEYHFELWKPLLVAFLFLGTVVLSLMLKTKA